VTLIKEGFDDFKRFRRDHEANSQKYEILIKNGTKKVSSSSIKVGNLLILKTNERGKN
jgi:phospholipid-translocating ATPase